MELGLKVWYKMEKELASDTVKSREIHYLHQLLISGFSVKVLKKD